jgi:hypothetical protein
MEAAMRVSLRWLRVNDGAVELRMASDQSRASEPIL